MAVTAADLTHPVGEVFPAWFPDTASNLTMWIGLGEALVPSGATGEQADAAVTAYAYWRAYDSKLMLLAASPDTVNLDGLGVTVKDSRVWFNTKAKQWKAAFDAVLETVAAGVGTVAPSPPPPASGSVAFSVRF